MNPDRFDEIQELFHAVQEASPADRAALLESANADVRREVESLLARVSGQSPVDAPVLAGFTQTLESGATVLTIGTQLGPYQVQRKLGEGGMGQVFAAVDTRRMLKPMAVCL